MKRNILRYISAKVILTVSLGFTLASCNTELPDPTPLTFPVATTSIGEYMASDTNFRLFRIAANKVGTFANLSDRNRSYTVYAPTNAAFRAIGFDSAQIVAASGATLTSLGAIVGYHIIPGEIWKSTEIPTTFPNVELPTAVAPGVLPGTPIPFPLRAYLSRRASGFWYNNVPGLPTTVDFTYSSLNQISRVSIPPSTMTKQVIDADPNLSLFDSLILRADSGLAPTASTSFTGLLLNPGANFTVFAPNNSGIKAYLAFVTGGLLPPAAPDAAHAAFIRTMVPVATARGAVAYHLLAVQTATSYVPHRIFSVNFSATGTFYKTLVNADPAGVNHPGVNVTSFFTGQIVDSMKVIGAGLTGQGTGPVATAKPPATFDRLAVNGVVHIIDNVLRP